MTQATVQQVSERFVELMNLIALVNHHREHCEEGCTVALFPLKRVATELAYRLQGAEFIHGLRMVNETRWL